MGNVVRMIPRNGLDAKSFLIKLVEDYGDQLDGAIIVALAKDGEVITGWSRGVSENLFMFMGILEQFKLDFWNSLFSKRAETTNI